MMLQMKHGGRPTDPRPTPPADSRVAGSGSESEAGKHATDGEGKSDKKKMSLKQIEERIAKLESTTL